MSEIRGASVIVVGAGASGLSAAWWLAREGVDVLVLDRGIAGWEASGRNGGGCSHHFSPLLSKNSGSGRRWTRCSATPRNSRPAASASPSTTVR